MAGVWFGKNRSPHLIQSYPKEFRLSGVNPFDSAHPDELGQLESESFQINSEALNFLNQTNCFGPQAAEGNIGGKTFGRATGSTDPNSVQVGAKSLFRGNPR
jgi:hypothetical protein